jgi:hypothetical protein
VNYELYLLMRTAKRTFNVHGSLQYKNILIYIQQNATLHILFYFIWKLLYMFRVVHHPSSGAQTTISTASVICYTVTATFRYRGRVGTGLSVVGGVGVFQHSHDTNRQRHTCVIPEAVMQFRCS